MSETSAPHSTAHLPDPLVGQVEPFTMPPDLVVHPNGTIGDEPGDGETPAP